MSGSAHLPFTCNTQSRYFEWAVPSISTIGRRRSFATQFNRGLALLIWFPAAFAQTNDDRYPIVKNGKVGFIDPAGNEVIAPQFSPVADMAHFTDALAPVSGPDGAGYIDVFGRFAIGPQRQWGQPRPFHEGIAAVLIWGDNGAQNKAAFIDRTGRIVFSGAGANWQAYFAEGLMPLSDGRKWGFADKSFRWVIPPRYDVAAEFSDGVAPVQVGRKWGYIDRAGNEIVPPKYDMACQFSGGLGRVRIDSDTGGKTMTREGLQPVYRHRYGFVDRNGKEAIQPQFKSANDFHEDRAFVVPAGSRRFEIIDAQGNIVHQAEYDDATELHEGLAAARVNGKWGYVDASGEWAIASQFSAADRFQNGLARIAWKGGYGYIDRTGSVIWKTTPAQSSP